VFSSTAVLYIRHGVILRTRKIEMDTAGDRPRTHILGLMACLCARISVVEKDIWENVLYYKRSKEVGLVSNVK